jgi:hypothetical protein
MTIRSIFRKLVGSGVIGAVLFFAGHFAAAFMYDSGAQAVAQTASFQIYAAYKSTGVYPTSTPTAAANPADIGELLAASGSESLPSVSAGSNQTAEYWSNGRRYVLAVTDSRSGHTFCIDSGDPGGLHQVDAATDCIR